MTPRLLLAGLLLAAALPAWGQKPPEKKDLPAVTVCTPLGVAPGSTTKLTVRGLRLDQATEVRFHEPKTRGKLLSKGKTAVPNQQEVTRVGDTQAEIEITVPPDVEGETTFSFVTAAGESPPHKLLITAMPVTPEKEPNNGFRDAQPVTLPVLIEGAIQQPQDVDVFRIDGKAGQKIVCEVQAGRYGSSVDSVLTFYNAAGQLLASNDDALGTDSLLEVTLPADGVYYLSLIDAHDQGGPAHPYRLLIRTR
jgi:hypothetical protein